MEPMTPERWATMDDDARHGYVAEVMAHYRNGEMVGYFGFNGGGPATDKAKGYVRALLARHAGKPEAEVMRWYLNDMRHQTTIDRGTVHAVLTVLTRITD